jgi:hypothetical protein
VRGWLPTAAVVLVAGLAIAPPVRADSAPGLSVRPATVRFGQQQTVRSAGWPVIEFCSRTVRLALLRPGHAEALGTVRVRASGAWTFRWTPSETRLARGSWTLRARMRCESGRTGATIWVRSVHRITIARRATVSLLGYGPARFGMSPRRAGAALHARIGRCGGVMPCLCPSIFPSEPVGLEFAPSGLAAVFSKTSRARAARGIRIGTSRSALLHAYPGLRHRGTPGGRYDEWYRHTAGGRSLWFALTAGQVRFFYSEPGSTGPRDEFCA